MKDLVIYHMSTESGIKDFNNLKEMLLDNAGKVIDKQGDSFVIEIEMKGGKTLEEPGYGLRVNVGYGERGQIHISDTTYTTVNFKMTKPKKPKSYEKHKQKPKKQ